MKRAALEATLARLQAIKDGDILMDRYGYITEGRASNPGCLAQQVVLANLPDPNYSSDFNTGETADKILGLDAFNNTSDLEVHRQLFLAPHDLVYNIAPHMNRQNVINVVQRLLDTSVVDWRPEHPNAERYGAKPIPVTLD